MSAPHIVALGGTLRAESATGRLLARALEIAAARGARTTLLTGDAIAFPHYEPGNAEGNPTIGRYLEALRSADAVIVGSPGYHGTLSGLVKTALDYVEQLRGDERVYLDGLPVGLIATAAGWQAAVSTLQALRTITHSLRGWPTPMGLAINTAEPGDAIDKCRPQMDVMVGQIFDFLHR
ncbi:NAD(P)H-dependent oxidoreductase [Sphingomonas sp. HF-S4]|uniref:NAD(P)H-dependent oxidoreductase n=1 Tax=Sphingomonas agrestis TaxID=3080540 RepID=A0ABU3YAG7_9SPHN|nr:NAD(P)H-dependent oxidoreductase [Sphingomonas sp. HF-S4]MDV3458405.1 NAD(P)H-dependent oxidoreductase [Sphingomonas sp. HF-S4]